MNQASPTTALPRSDLRRGTALSFGIWAAAATLMLVAIAPFSWRLLPVVKILASSTFGAIACTGLWRLGQRLTRLGRGIGALAFCGGVAGVLALHLGFDMGLYRVLHDPAVHAEIRTDRWYMAIAMRLTLETRVLLYAAVYGVFGAAALAMLWADEQRRQDHALSEARLAAAHAQLAALRLQLNPHFLFNTLNAIGALVVTRRNAEAERMLERLSAFLRSTLTAPVSSFTTLEDELATVESYLDVESIRFADRLSVRYRCPPALRQAQAPGFILQPLVENAIKHGVSPALNKVTLTVQATARDSELVLEVIDDGAGGAGAGGGGVGLANVRERLAILYGGSARLEAGREDGIYVARIRLPLSMAFAEAAA